MSSSFLHTILQVCLMLGLMVALIMLLGWLAKRTQGFGLQGGKHFKILQSLPLGHKEKAVLIEIDGSKLLLGVTANQVTSLWSGSSVVESTQTVEPLSVKNKSEDFSFYIKKILSRDLQ